MIKFLVNKPVAYIKEIKSVVVTDLHIGIEHELYMNGIFIPSQAETFAMILKEVSEITNAKNLIILGDVKHEVTHTTFRESKEVPKFFSLVSNYFDKIYLVKGNHDSNIEKILNEKIKIYGSHGYKIKNYGFFHGHAWPAKTLFQCDWLFMGHLQPAIELKDLFGYKIIERVWLKGRIDRKRVSKLLKVKKTGKLNLIIVPSFNNLAGFMILNRENKIESFITKIANFQSFDVYLLDGTHLGKLSSLQPST